MARRYATLPELSSRRGPECALFATKVMVRYASAASHARVVATRPVA
jgi:hypothetical protein